MSESKIMRLVRCPKCENLLPELAEYKVYQCGGCGAVLRARVKEQEAKVLAGRSDEQKVGVPKGMQETVESLLESGVAGRNVSDLDIESDCIAFASKENCGVKKDNYIESAARADPDVGVGGGELGSVEQVLNYSRHVRRSQGSEDMPPWGGEISDQCGFVKTENEGGRPLNNDHQEEGPSNYFSDSSYHNNAAEAGKDTNGLNRPKRFDSLQKDRAELLHMMEELRDQLRRSGNLGMNIKEKSPIDENAAHQRADRSSTSGVFNRNAAAPNTGVHLGFMPDYPNNSSYNYPHHFPQFPYGDFGQRIDVCDPHLFPYGHSDTPGHGNNFESQMMRGPFPTPNHYEHQIPYPPYFPGHSFAADPTMYAPNSNNRLLHHPVCSCYNCCSDHHRATMPDYTDDTRLYDIHKYPMLYPRNIPGPSALRGCTHKTPGPSSSLNGPSIRTRLTNDMPVYTHRFVRRHQQKEAHAKGGHHCHPIVSGAPFIICQSCSQLLELPNMTFNLKTKRQKLCCGACDTVMECAFINKKITISISGKSQKIAKEVSPCLDDVTHEGISSELFYWDKTNSVSDDFGSSSHEFRAVTGKPLLLTRRLDFTSNETQDSQSLPPSSPACFEGIESSEGLASPSPNDLPVQDQLGHSFNANVTSRVWKGSQSTRSDHEKVIPKDMISRQNSLNETSSTAQIEEVSVNVCSTARVSQKSEHETTQRNNAVKTNKGSSFAGVIKKSLEGLSRSNHSADNREVLINGCKIPDRLVKKAEKRAGPIKPGNYWYDFRAGFWGVVGGHCLGIIPPFIGEFNYPMPANCSCGTTGVFVNGRELQQIDLDLLASRGLPFARGRSYVIEISGKVVDTDSGEELVGLGKLAPTIEKVKHGFGMKPQTQLA